jgi:hypothetical protein
MPRGGSFAIDTLALGGNAARRAMGKLLRRFRRGGLLAVVHDAGLGSCLQPVQLAL